MIDKREVLRLVAKRNADGKSTSYRSVVDELWLSDEAACEHLKRLWQQRLIEPTEAREPGSEYSLVPGESIRELRFRLSERGGKRLKHWKREERREAEEGWRW